MLICRQILILNSLFTFQGVAQNGLCHTTTCQNRFRSGRSEHYFWGILFDDQRFWKFNLQWKKKERQKKTRRRLLHLKEQKSSDQGTLYLHNVNIQFCLQNLVGTRDIVSVGGRPPLDLSSDSPPIIPYSPISYTLICTDYFFFSFQMGERQGIGVNISDNTISDVHN